MTIKTLKFKIKPESYSWLNKAAIEVNQVWNWANSTAEKAIRTFSGKGTWLTGYDLNNLSAGASEYFDRINADVIQRINCEYAAKRFQAKKTRLRYRKSFGPRKALGWIPFKANQFKRK